MAEIRAKKHLGQHFLIDLEAAEKISNALSFLGYDKVLEVGPGTGVLTQFLIKKPIELHAIELDRESIPVLHSKFPEMSSRLYNEDLLKWNEPKLLKENKFALIGNYPYNISSQILFWMLSKRDQIPEMVGMFQKEVGIRIASKPGNKNYGITSVLTQAYYEVEYLFTISPDSFLPPPRVQSGVIRLRKKTLTPDVEYKTLALVVKTAFNQRRKTLRNALKSLSFDDTKFLDTVSQQRAEQLSNDQFITLAQSLNNVV
ncbi:MAG: Ribosomal RNA small subunit methyltransferase A [Owenweeksia sp. TMED14]|nr:MAG: Ribosomal RNA small subunit methyltransferase A [Owenweeksia sp. TMED14]